MMNEINRWNESEAPQSAMADHCHLQEQLMELDHTLYEMEFYLQRNPEDEMAVLHFKQFKRKRLRMAAELASGKVSFTLKGEGEKSLQFA